MKRLPFLALGLLLWAAGLAAQEFQAPPLTGRVVDQAGMLDAAAEVRLTQMLAAHEQASGEQVVVVTLPDLQGRTIEEVGLQLGRQWGIGQRGEDSGALLIVARDERRIRIEVGYGLEGRLTDAQASLIINRIITPAFQQGDFARGITEGAAAMVQVLGGDPLRQASYTPAGPQAPEGALPVLLFFVLLVVMMMLGGGGGGGRRGGMRRGVLLGALLGGMSRGSGMGGGGGFGGGGFGGGGGGFGGGGASGGW
ncbi:TPM domain-containing protein [Stutzerimonas azotifigens]|uniref:TPM domain-containing protein n=1 Tax=Stutzerimonas azotifigens TaxID=291995 RepID=UPI00040BA5FC